ncbi:MAG: hypothetical protein LE168_04395 [Endomicrobium sp.]|nr:hypothetical protein [Endomicrobium sp.]
MWCRKYCLPLGIVAGVAVVGAVIGGCWYLYDRHKFNQELSKIEFTHQHAEFLPARGSGEENFVKEILKNGYGEKPPDDYVYPIDTGSYHGTFFTNPPQPAAPLPPLRPTYCPRDYLYIYDNMCIIDNLRLPKNIVEAGMEINAIDNERNLIEALIKENHTDSALLRNLEWHNFKRRFLLYAAITIVEQGVKNGKRFVRYGYEGYNYGA